ncbi:hypothetical protein GBAR_LOCUS10528, partial [Geodia barretti]
MLNHGGQGLSNFLSRNSDPHEANTMSYTVYHTAFFNEIILCFYLCIAAH